MKFQKALKEAIVRNRESANRLDEATIDDFVANWPILVADMVRSTTNTSNKNLLSSYLSSDITLSDGRTKWVGKMNDIINAVKKQSYNSTTYLINSTDEPITKGATQIPPKSIIVDGKAVGYVSQHPAVILLVNKINTLLKSQINDAGDKAATQQTRDFNKEERVKRIQQQAERNSIQRKTELGIK